MDHVAAPVVVAVDEDAASLSAARWAVDEAVDRGTSIRLVTVVDPAYADDDAVLMASRRALRSAVDAIRACNDMVEVNCHLLYGDAVEVLRDQTEHAAMLCLGTDGRGSDFTSLVTSAQSPVAVVRGRRRKSPSSADRWVIALLGQPETAAAVLRAAITETRLRHAALMALTPPRRDADEYITCISGSHAWAAESGVEIWAMPGGDDVLGIVAQCPELEHVIVVSADDVRVLAQLIRAAGDPVHAESDFSLLVVPRPACRHVAQRADLTLVDPGVFGLQTCAVSTR